MRLIDAAGHGVDLRVTGYQFPDAESLAAALTCDESLRIAAWLRGVARGQFSPATLTFTEPNLSVAATGGTLDIDLALAAQTVRHPLPPDA